MIYWTTFPKDEEAGEVLYVQVVQIIIFGCWTLLDLWTMGKGSSFRTIQFSWGSEDAVNYQLLVAPGESPGEDPGDEVTGSDDLSLL